MSKHGVFGFVLGVGVGFGAAALAATKLINKAKSEVTSEKDTAIIESVKELVHVSAEEIGKFVRETQDKVNSYIERVNEASKTRCSCDDDVDDAYYDHDESESCDEYDEYEEYEDYDDNEDDISIDDLEDTEEVDDVEFGDVYVSDNSDDSDESEADSTETDEAGADSEKTEEA